MIVKAVIIFSKTLIHLLFWVLFPLLCHNVRICHIFVTMESISIRKLATFSNMSSEGNNATQKARTINDAYGWT